MNRSNSLHLVPALSLLGVALAGCPAATGSGTLRIDVSGEEAAVGGYPAGDIVFRDGWTMRFDHVFAAVGEVSLEESGVEFIVDDAIRVVDLAEGDVTYATVPGVPAQRWSEFVYHLHTPTASSGRVGRVTADDVTQMVASGSTLRLVGTATHPTHGMYTFDVGIPAEVHMSGCESGRDGTPGIVVPTNAIYETQLTLHLDHFFFDSARAEEPNLRFDAWAAVAGDDRHITYAELANQSLADLRGINGQPLMDGMTPVVYEPPATGLPMPNLQAFLYAQALTIGHFEGEGHCDYAQH